MTTYEKRYVKGPPPRFDHDEAIRLRKGGMTYTAISRMMGVSETAVARVCDPRLRAAVRTRTYAYSSQGRCVDCGERISSNPTHPASRCRECYASYRSTSVRPDTLWCTGCGEWKGDEEFPQNRVEKNRRYRHASCRSCQTVQRRAYRERSKIPCDHCGTLCLPPSEKRRGGSGPHGDHPCCRKCWHAHHRHQTAT